MPRITPDPHNLKVLFTLALLFSLVPANFRAAVLDPALEAKLRDPRAGVQAVLVTAAAPLKIGALQEKNKKRRRSEAAQKLREAAGRNRAPLEQWLRARGVAFRPLWIANAVALTAPPEILRELAATPLASSIRPDGIVKEPSPKTARQAPGAAGGAEWNISAIKAPELWALGVTGAGVVVASLDTGIDAFHVDLAGRWRGGSNSWFDPSGQHATPTDTNAEAHGTGVMGIILAGSPGGTAVGVAPGARWISAKIFDDSGNSPASSIHAAYQWVLDPDDNAATDDAPDVVNNSWALTDYVNVVVSEFVPDVNALRTAGIAVVAAAGNSGPAAGTSLSPANYAGVLSVGALRNNGGGNYGIAYSSSRGPLPGGGLYPLLAAPGEDVLTTDQTFKGTFITATAVRTGSSYAAPHVTGALALLMEAFPTATVSQLEEALLNSAADLGAAGPDNDYGHGMLNVRAAYDLLKGQLTSAADPAWLAPSLR